MPGMRMPSNACWRARLIALLCAALTEGALVTGCRGDPTLYDVTVDPASITPDGDGNADVSRIAYSVGAPALVSITLTDPTAGASYVFRDQRPRSPGTYEALFGGVVDGRMVPDGDYVLDITAWRRHGAVCGGRGSVGVGARRLSCFFRQCGRRLTGRLGAGTDAPQQGLQSTS